jgi:methionine synthase II (cobalamin-independent)
MPAKPARGELTPAGLKAAEDRAVREVVALQEELGLPVVNDGEMRRESFQSELTAACDGRHHPQAQRAKLALLVRAAHDFLPAPAAT